MRLKFANRKNGYNGPGFASRWKPLLFVGLALLAAAVMFAGGALLQRNGSVAKTQDWVLLHLKPSYFQSQFDAPTLPKMSINMKFRNVQQIEAKRTTALDQGFLFASSLDFVPATIRFDDTTVSVDMRLKGDELDHLQGNKWSYRLEVKGNSAILGIRRLSMHDPSRRNFLFEWAYLEHLRAEGVLAPRYSFADVTFNGEKLGIYALEEHFSKELLESQGRREGIVIRFDEASLWDQRALSYGNDADIFSADYTVSTIDAFRDTHIDQSPELIAQRSAAVGLLRGYAEGTLASSEVFDVQLMGRFLAVNELWAARHGLNWHNLRFYFNPLSGKLEPIGFDAHPNFDASPFLVSDRVLDLTDDPAISEVYVQEMARISTAEYLTELKSSLDSEYDRLNMALTKEFGRLPSPWAGIEGRQRVIKGSINTAVTVLAFQDDGTTDSTSVESVAKISARNALRLPVEILGFKVGNGDLIPASEVIQELSEGGISDVRESSVIIRGTRREREELGDEFVRFVIQDIGPADSQGTESVDSVVVVSRLLGLPDTRESIVHPYPPAFDVGILPERPSVEEVLTLHPFLAEGDSPGQLHVQSGRWNVVGDLVLPVGVRLIISNAAPTTLLFEEDSILFASEPLIFLGTEHAPVILAPQVDSWSGVFVLEAEENSIWDRVQISGALSFQRSGWISTGAVTFYKSPVHLRNCQFVDIDAEDALNIVGTQFEITSCGFANLRSDGFDGDFVSGRVIDSSFQSIGGDGLDFSGSDVEITGVSVIEIGDKGISAGESSSVRVNGFTAESVGIGIASKDSSVVGGSQITIQSARLSALAAYQKKSEYGPGNMTLDGVSVVDSSRVTLVQTDSWIRMNDRHVTGSVLDDEALIAEGILGE